MITVDIKVDYEKAGLSAEGCKATLDCYVPIKTEEMGVRKRKVIIICPGGGYDYCSEREAEPVAFKFNGAGFTSFVLRYSVYKKKFPTDCLEVAAAIKYVRDNAEEFDIDPDKIVVMGFSAGGHLAASIANFWSSDFVTKPLDCKPEDIKVNGSILCYPVITSGEYCHEGSILNLIGDSDDGTLREMMSIENQVSDKTPETFIWHCSDDGCVPVENALYYMNALSKNHIKFECHIYDNGGHGLSLCDKSTATWDGHNQPIAAQWVQCAIDWMNRL